MLYPMFTDETNFNMEWHLIQLLQDAPFFAELSRNIRKVPTKALPTAGIAYDPELDEICLYWNPEFFAPLTVWQVRGVLIHEFYHFVFGHLGARRRTPPTLWNIASDLAINSIIIDNVKCPSGAQAKTNDGPLPDCVLLPGKWPTPPNGRKLSQEEKNSMPMAAAIAAFPKMQASEWYFNKLYEVAKKSPMNSCPVHGPNGSQNKQKGQQGKGQQGNQGQNGQQPGDQGGDKGQDGKDGQGNQPGESGGGQQQQGGGGGDHQHGDGNDQCTCGGDGWINSFDDHGGWDSVPADMREYIEGRAKAILEKAVKVADQHSNGWGSVPAEIREEIRLAVSNIINWRNVLRQFIGSINRGNRTTSIKRINRRYPYIHPGTKRGYTAKLLIAVDQSGSVDDGMLSEFFAELASLTKKTSIDIVHFDTVCSNKDIIPWKRGQKVRARRTRCGGTDFNAPTRLANDPKNRGRWDGLIVCSDGECEKPGPSRIKRGWVIGKGQKLLFSTDEMVIRLDDAQQKTSGAWRTLTSKDIIR